MINKDDISEREMIDAINEFEVIYRIHKAILLDSDGRLQEEFLDGLDAGRKIVLDDIEKILDSLKEKKYKKPEIIK
tara:strand:- start:142 stop:369 length:228 start_codon:yes stop_codon:yes gene_type:complete